MRLDDQREVIEFLSGPAVYGAHVGPVERIDTHISIVWLAGPTVYKLKRAVWFDYVDFSTRERRRAACETEVRLNRRTAPVLYRGVRAVTREADGGLRIGGSGDPVDWLVEMERFDQETLFDRLAARQQLDPMLMAGLADAIVRLHAGAEPRRDHGGREGMAWVVDGNALGLAEQGAGVFERAVRDRLIRETRAVLDHYGSLLDARQQAGLVRSCHGDLHLRNICLVEGGRRCSMPSSSTRIFPASMSSTIWRSCSWIYGGASCGSTPTSCSTRIWRRQETSEGLPLLPLFLSCRAAVRAKTSVTAAAVQGEGCSCARDGGDGPRVP